MTTNIPWIRNETGFDLRLDRNALEEYLKKNGFQGVDVTEGHSYFMNLNEDRFAILFLPDSFDIREDTKNYNDVSLENLANATIPIQFIDGKVTEDYNVTDFMKKCSNYFSKISPNYRGNDRNAKFVDRTKMTEWGLKFLGLSLGAAGLIIGTYLEKNFQMSYATIGGGIVGGITGVLLGINLDKIIFDLPETLNYNARKLFMTNYLCKITGDDTKAIPVGKEALSSVYNFCESAKKVN